MQCTRCSSLEEALQRMVHDSVTFYGNENQTIALSRNSHAATLVQAQCAGARRDSRASTLGPVAVVTIPLPIEQVEEKLLKIRGG